VSLAASREEIKVQASKAREFEKRANTMIEEAKKSVNQLRSSSLLQEGLRAKAEIGMSEAAKEMAAAQDAAAAVAVERKLLQDRMESLIQERDSLHDQVEQLSVQLDQTQLNHRNKVVDSQEFLDVKNENKQLSAVVQRLEKEVASANEVIAELKEEVANCRESEEMMRQAMEEAAQAKQVMRKQWNEAEDALYEMSQARAAADDAKRKMTEALVRERSSRIMAQQNLERLQAQKSDVIPVDVLADVDKARLALWHEEMAAEHKSLELILEAVQEINRAE
jgi:chromosome segregation ATPase